MPKKTLTVISLSIYLFLYLFFLNRQSQERFGEISHKGTKAVIEKNLANEPENDGRLQKFYLSTYKIITSAEPQYHYGDRIKVIGRLEASLIKQDNSGAKSRPLIGEVLNQTFGKSAKVLYFPKIEKIANQNGHPIVFWAQTLRRLILNIYVRVLPSPEAALLSGVVLGEKASLPNDFKTALRTTGTTHVVAASGMNVTYMVIIFSGLTGLFVNKRRAGLLAVGACWFYVLLAEASPPVVRAGMMGSMILLAKFLGREPRPLWVLVLTAGLMLLISPLLLWDIGFQLSALSMAGLILFEEKTAEGLNRLVISRQLPLVFVESLAASFSAQLLTLPILVYNFGAYSPFSLLVNALVLWLVPLIMALGLVVGFLGLLNIKLAYPAALITYLPLNIFVEMVKFFGERVPVAVFKFDFFSIIVFSFGWYLLIFLLVLRPRHYLCQNNRFNGEV